ncbi:kinase-like domain-containing protein [Ilyonectria robusta]|uniref:kinase-like domain-containing protein n=1 Tax=Ilyonectria robusta TaxID=1079257 RepID=UPI001E8CC766|nr:kinase-like domain-containing protein [Ilyonectria robusta]KAH8683770.1 kinase-like domain-containing protein [Ilyonectria robusta]
MDAVLSSDDSDVEAVAIDSRRRPYISSFQNLHSLAESFNVDDGFFSHCTFSYLGPNYTFYFGQSPKTKKELTLQLISDALKRIPAPEIYPRAPSRIKVYPHAAIDEHVYLKLPNILRYEELAGTNLMARLCLHEVNAFEQLERLERHHHTHPNIAKYHGCIVRGERVVGVVIDRYPITLADRIIEEGSDAFPWENCLQRIESAIKHLHKLGLAHNDLNPNNIMLDNSDVPYLIDLGSCRPFGKGLVTAGTVGWVDGDFTVSAIEHDEVGLRKLKAWFEKNLIK